MNPTETSRMVDIIKDLDNNTETAFAITEHDMSVISDISDRILVLHEGRLFLTETRRQCFQIKRSKKRTSEVSSNECPYARGCPLVLRNEPHPAGMNFEINAGETVALLGRNGAGKTTTMRSITGLLEPGAGV